MRTLTILLLGGPVAGFHGKCVLLTLEQELSGEAEPVTMGKARSQVQLESEGNPSFNIGLLRGRGKVLSG